MWHQVLENLNQCSFFSFEFLGLSLVKGEGDQPHSNLHNDAPALCVPRVNISLPAPRAACQGQ